MKTSLLTWVLLTTATASTAVAIMLPLLPAPPQHGEVATAFLDALDDNHDGAISEAEYQAVADDTLPFSVVDIDADGVVRAWELEVVLVSLSPLRDARLVRVL